MAEELLLPRIQIVVVLAVGLASAAHHYPVRLLLPDALFARPRRVRSMPSVPSYEGHAASSVRCTNRNSPVQAERRFMGQVRRNEHPL